MSEKKDDKLTDLKFTMEPFDRGEIGPPGGGGFIPLPWASSAEESIADKRKRWLDVIEYEVQMLGETRRMLLIVHVPLLYAQPVVNSITESRVLHARNLCEFCCKREGKDKDDIKPEDLFDDYNADRCETLRGWVEKVRGTYHQEIETVVPNGKIERITPRIAFNKMFAHPTQKRGLSFNYQPFLDLVEPKIENLAEELRRLVGLHFPSLLTMRAT